MPIKLNQKIISDLGNFIKMRYGIDLNEHSNKPELLANFVRLQYWIDDIILEKYFAHNEDAVEKGSYWKQQLAYETRRTGKELEDRMRKLRPQRVLDVGCGDNEWKRVLGDALWGIDPYNEKAHEIVDILNFKNRNIGKYDIVLALGSINFGDDTTIFSQVEKVVECVKPGGKIFWRLNPGITHDNKGAQWIDFYPWSEEKVREFAQRLNCVVDEFDWDQSNQETIRWGNRYYSEWTKEKKK